MALPLASIVLALAAMATPAVAAEIKVFSGGAPQGVLETLVPKFEAATGHKVSVSYIVITEQQKRLREGERPDAVLMPIPAIEGLVRDGKLAAEGRALFGTVRLAAIVREGAPKPDVSTPEALRATLLAAKSIVHATPGVTPSGNHMREMIDKLGVGDAIKDKTLHRPALSGGVETVAKGEAEIGIYPASESAHVKGVAQAGLLPESLQLKIVYGAAVPAGSASAPARALIDYLASAANRAVWKDNGFDPPSD